jgi:Rrf2 family protein
MLSNSSKYAIKAVLYLALHSDENNKIRTKNIGKPINVPQHYIAKLLQDLSRHDIVSSTKGPNGGFYLTDENRYLPLMNIIEVIDGKKKMGSCLLSLEDCNENKPCPLHELIAPSRSKFIKSLETKTINDLAMDLKDKKAFLPL